MSRELLPCPWCGEIPIQGPWKAAISDISPDAWAIECSGALNKCPVNPAVSDFERERAIEAWNTRAPMSVTNDPRVVELVEADKAFDVAFHAWAGDKKNYMSLQNLADATDRRAAALANLEKKE